MEKQTDLTILLGRIAYWGSRLLISIIFLAGFAIIPWMYVFYYLIIWLALSLTILGFGWRGHTAQLMEYKFDKLFSEGGMISMKDLMGK